MSEARSSTDQETSPQVSPDHGNCGLTNDLFALLTLDHNEFRNLLRAWKDASTAEHRKCAIWSVKCVA